MLTTFHRIKILIHSTLPPDYLMFFGCEYWVKIKRSMILTLKPPISIQSTLSTYHDLCSQLKWLNSFVFAQLNKYHQAIKQLSFLYFLFIKGNQTTCLCAHMCPWQHNIMTDCTLLIKGNKAISPSVCIRFRGSTTWWLHTQAHSSYIVTAIVIQLVMGSAVSDKYDI